MLLFTAQLCLAQKLSTFSNERFTIKYPAEWQFDDSGMMGTSFVIFSPQENDEDLFRENVNLIDQDLSAYNFDLDRFVELSLSQLEMMITNYDLVSNKRMDTTPPFHKLVYNGMQGQFYLTYVQYAWVLDSRAYILTFTVEQSQFSDYQKIGESILNSFKIN